MVHIGEHAFYVEVADTAEARTRGLSGREMLSSQHGMLFIFDDVQRHAFWMKDMNFPIDIIWIDERWRVVDITYGARPDAFPEIFSPRVPVRYVLEVNAGEARDIKIGDDVTFVK